MRRLAAVACLLAAPGMAAGHALREPGTDADVDSESSPPRGPGEPR